MVKKPAAGPKAEEYTDQMKAATEQGLANARKAFDEMMGVAQKSIEGLETSTSTLQGHMRDVSRGSLDFAEETVEASFSMIEAMMRAGSPQELVEIQQKFMQGQMERLGTRARSLGENTMKAAQDLTRPFES
ncbi:phasin family protein [Methylobrevis pamukkalensis]|uniref:Phasin protein n=1 Tax=Methylobrevis pamukkalensis TaxID=1439726 RepID=A0A1E3H5B9_9HYPH|nr:phasin family protein [Methylobrevis pamukkalensis]ODN71513.1 Phasin protein [Methylobrevis pamukkalensis]